MVPVWIKCFVILAVVFAHQVIHTRSIGVCFGMLGDNLPSPADVVALYKKNNINSMRIFNPDPAVLNALQQSGINLAIGTTNADIPNLAASPNAALQWVNTNIVPYPDVKFQYLTVGNEAIPGENAQYIAPAMKNLRDALNSLQLGAISVTTVVPSTVLGTSYPPSAGSFSSETISDMTNIISYLATYEPENPKRTLMVNVYPYFAYVADPVHVSLNFAQFTATAPAFNDTGLQYWNLFDAMVDSFYSAMERVGGTNVAIAISESGWPSAGNGEFTTTALAQTYNSNLMNHVAKGGTPKRPTDLLDSFLFAMFNEDQKQPGVEQNFGLFYPNEQPVYPLF
ncbi:putative glucan endo-1,3-beta-glucosidase GVI [Asparagus officinalis]|uniref:putative glucan endo-1,3-beta-glucosidase GVI n=1 Tax=Asparagus officinalis TaxID=4686 RepID=UPI00098E0D8A|nr:putative glucan endo-1,3-beta-glucosidase GVI [Asparagus officinalis]